MPGVHTHFIYPPILTHTQGQGHVSPKINKLLFKSCKSIKLIFIISAHDPVVWKSLSSVCFWITMHYSLICIHRLYVVGSLLSVFCAAAVVEIKPLQGTEMSFVCVAFRTQRSWTQQFRCILVIGAVRVEKKWCRTVKRDGEQWGGDIIQERKREMSTTIFEHTSQPNVYSLPVLLCSRVLLVPKATREKE